MLSHKLKLIHVERNTTPQHLFSTIPESTQYEIRFRVLYVFYAYYYVSSSGAGSKQEKKEEEVAAAGEWGTTRHKKGAFLILGESALR